MTVNTTNITSGPYIGNGIADTFSYTFRVEDKTQLSVFETDDLGVETLLVVDTDYTVSGIGVDNGGTIARASGALPLNFTWYIRSDYKETQLTAFDSQGAFFPELHEQATDKLTFLTQQQRDTLNRSMRLSDSFGGDVDMTLPPPTANKGVRWNGTADGLENTADDLDDLITQSAANAAAAAASEVQTGLDAAATAADRVQTALDVTATNADVVTTTSDAAATTADAVSTNADAIATAADRVQTGLDAATTNANVIITNADVVQTGLDATATAADAGQTVLDATATAADRVQTGLDVTASGISAAAASVSETNAAISAAKIPNPTAGDIGKVVTVNAAEDGYDLDTPGAGDLIAANNLSDVANASTSFNNIKQNASITSSGAVEKATQPEMDAGEADKFPDAATVKAFVDSVVTIPRGYINGFHTTSLGVADTDHDLEIQQGQATDSTQTEIIELSSSIIKRLDANWAVGTNAGGLDTGSIAADTTYFIHVIKRSDTGNADVLYSLSPNAPTLPANYDLSRLIWAFLTDASANIRPYAQEGDDCDLVAPTADFNSTSPGTNLTIGLAVPTGADIVVRAKITCRLKDNSPSGETFLILSSVTNSQSPTEVTMTHVANPEAETAINELLVWTNSSGEVRARLDESNSGIRLTVITRGWTFKRSEQKWA